MAKRFMKIRRVVIPFLTLAIMLSQLSGCAVVSPEDIVDNPDDVTLVIEEPDLEDVKGDKSTVEINGEKYDISDAIPSGSQDDKVAEPQIVEMPQDMLHDLFKEQYEFAKACKQMDKDYGTDSYDLYKKLPAGDIGTQEDTNVYNKIKIKVYGSAGGGIGRDSYSSLSDGFGSDVKYYGKYNLPTDGFAQYVSWRQQYEASLNKSNSTSNSSTSQTPSQQPSNSNNTLSGSGNQSQPSGGSTPPNNTDNGGNNGNNGKYTGDGISQDLLDEWNNGFSDDPLPKPDYEIIG